MELFHIITNEHGERDALLFVLTTDWRLAFACFHHWRQHV